MILLAVSGCGKNDKEVILVFNNKDPKPYFNRFDSYLDKKTCTVMTEDMSPVDALDPSVDSLVCMYKERYLKRRAQVKSDCESSK